MINHLELKVKNIMKENVDLQETILQLKENQEHEFSINKCLKEKLIYHD